MKRVRYCQHCCQNVTYRVYKKHQEEFYDVTSKQWIVARTCCSAEGESWSTLDAEDDQIISNAINSTGKIFY